ncbi:MauE/DoxX family redox-associated membrane protein [Kitasatospora phosalacinea]|uniref:MauE/DoxX family redox-associated membrane protein n=1 Tax=Kitasatospora phosalacinea TaxID=2065 RepID=UPI003649CA13
MGYLELACRTATLLVLLTAAVAKSRDLKGFADSLRRLAPPLRGAPGAARLLAPAVVLAEAGTAAALAVPAAATRGLLLALALEAGFAAVIAVAIRRPDTGTCRCFGTRGRPWSARHLVRDGLLMALAATGLAAARTHPGAGNLPGQAVAVAAGAFAALLVVFFDDMVEVFS